MSNEQLQDYKKKLKLYEKLLELWQKVYGDQPTGKDDGPGTLPPPPPPPPPPPHG